MLNKKILVTHDGSEMSDKALLHAIFLTKIANAELVIVNVIDIHTSTNSICYIFTMNKVNVSRYCWLADI